MHNKIMQLKRCKKLLLFNYCFYLTFFSDVSVGFSVSSPDTSSGFPLKFRNVIYSTGNEYNKSSGIFTCKHPGVYFFTANVLRSPGIYVNECSIRVNGISMLLVTNVTRLREGYQSGSGSFIYHLISGDTVSLSGCPGVNYIYSYSSFTGFRISF
jgi:hypothetical protein